MPQTAAERQRAYKARQKAKGVDFAEVQRDWRAQNKDKVYLHNQKQKPNKAAYSKTDKGKATLKRFHDKRMTDPGKRIVLSIGSRITQSMNHASNTPSNRLMKHTEFVTSEDVRNHFQSLWEPWMNWSNYGPHLPGVLNWNVGHRIPLSYYNHHDLEDVRRCWSKRNLFPQNAEENSKMNNSWPGDDVVWAVCDSVWPKSWDA
tara:strand:- start:1234 stop:1842 length:609 start_codon:yes stop_codon:yes gene_type:complete